MLSQITLPAKWSYAPVCVASSAATPSLREASLSIFPKGDPVARKSLFISPKGTPLRGGAVSLPSNAERFAVEWRANSPSKMK